MSETCPQCNYMRDDKAPCKCGRYAATASELAPAHGSADSLPKLRTMRDSDPITGEVWVVDENNHYVASFRVMLPECHKAGATKEIMHASRNKTLADALIEHLYSMWDIERCPPNNAICQPSAVKPLSDK